MGYILKLAGWYPSRVDIYNGDFVQRQARAISLYRKVIVLFLTKDPSLPRGKVDIHKSEQGNLTEYIVYYSKAGIFDKALSLWRYIVLGKKAIGMIRKEHGRPDLVHVNIVWKAGLIALYLKKSLNLKYVITENWTGFYKQDPLGLHSKSWLERKIYQKVFGGTSLFLPVSVDLGRQVSLLFPGIRSEVVYNAVDTDFFRYQPSKPSLSIKKLIHVSTFGYQKNIEGLLQTIGRLARVRDDFELTMVGPCPETLKKELEENGLLNKRVFLTGEIPYVEVATHMRRSHIMVLFSRFENLPCVLLEGFCCGLAAIGTNVGGIPEIINNENGMIVEPGNEEELLQTLHTMLNTYSGYDREKIAKEAAAVFSYQVIGKRFADIYTRIQ